MQSFPVRTFLICAELGLAADYQAVDISLYNAPAGGYEGDALE